MIASGRMPRSPVWLRKIPSTVSGSQGSRRGLRPAVRFAFPLGADVYYGLLRPGSRESSDSGGNYSGARADSAESSAFPQVAQSLPTGPCSPSLWRCLHNQGGSGAAGGPWAAWGPGRARAAARMEGGRRRRACPIRPIGGALAAEPRGPPAAPFRPPITVKTASSAVGAINRKTDYD